MKNNRILKKNGPLTIVTILPLVKKFIKCVCFKIFGFNLIQQIY